MAHKEPELKPKSHFGIEFELGFFFLFFSCKHYQATINTESSFIVYEEPKLNAKKTKKP